MRPRPSWFADAAAASYGPAKTRTRLIPVAAPKVLVPVRAHVTFDAAPRRSAFARARLAESSYARALNAIARNVDDLVRHAYDPERPAETAAEIARALRQYGKLIEPWARSVSRRMLVEVSMRDARAWRQVAREMGEAYAAQFLGETPIAGLIRKSMEEQVHLITSLPEQAAGRVHGLVLEGLAMGRRAEDVRDRVLETGHVTRSRAMTIARTEVGRAASEVVKARAAFIGSEGYVWRTAHDADVRKEHRKLEGKFVRWDDPPVAGSRGERAHAGAIYNCRCYPEPVIPRR